jgi:AraC-like DNA-binding protein
MTRAVVFERGGRARIAAVRFRPGGAAPFLGVPAEDLTDRVVDTADLGLRWLAEAPFQGDDVIGGVRTLERTLLERLPGVNSHEPQIEHAISALLGPDPPSIAVLARRVGWSRQQLGRAVRRAVGVSPKRLARVARLQRATALLQAEPDPGLAAVAIRAGYFDQAHMTRDFRDLADVTPAGAAASHGSIRPIRSLLGSL